LKALYERAKELVEKFENERKKRFEPFLWLLEKEVGKDVDEEKFSFALAVATYVLENAFHLTEEDREFYEFLKHMIDKYGKENYWKYVEKSPLPFPDYLKANYDFRKLNYKKSKKVVKNF